MTFLLSLLFLTPTSHADVRYEDLVRLADTQTSQVKQEGMNYAVGGALGLGLSVGLGIQTSEAFPKLGYSLIQVLSAAAVAHGASLYFQGNGITREGERLKIFSSEMEKAGVPAEKRKKILDEATAELVKKEVTRYKELRKIRGYLELTSAAASGLTLGLSKSKSSASSTALGFIILISLVGAYSDLLGPSDPGSMKELYSWSLLPSEKSVEIAWELRF